MSYKITKKELLFKLYIAESDASKHKRNKPCVVKFEDELNANLINYAMS